MTVADAPPVPLEPGRELLPGYRVDEHLARGQVLDVYAVWSDARECLCVAKTMRPDRLDDRDARHRLLEEGRLLARLTHPHLVRGYETTRRPRPTLILETLQGETLGHLLDRRRCGLPAGDLVELGVQLCSVVGYLHRNTTLHLDLKPSNVVAEAGRARLLDLSHARPPGPCPPGFGTREYMAPEQLLGQQVGEATDVYGLGGVLYRAATRRRPFTADGREGHTGRRPSFTPLRRRVLPRPFVQLVVAGLDPRPAGRPTVAEMMAVLTGLRPEETGRS